MRLQMTPPIASSIPGRLRLRAPGLRNPAHSEVLRAAVARWRGVQAVETNPKAGSLLILYDAERLKRANIEARIAAATEKVLDRRADWHAKVGAGGTARVRANRWAKRGMLASLAVSLLSVAAGAKRWHGLTGILFLHALAAHLWAHRRHLLR